MKKQYVGIRSWAPIGRAGVQNKSMMKAETVDVSEMDWRALWTLGVLRRRVWKVMASMEG